MIGRIIAACLLVAGSASVAVAQTTVVSSSPTLAEMLQNIYGPHGLTVESEAVLPDGSTHSAHFNGAFQSEFGRINIALVRQLGALPIPSPASGFTYAFDNSTGTFVRSTQSFGPILADRAETIGRGRFAFGYASHPDRRPNRMAPRHGTIRPHQQGSANMSHGATNRPQRTPNQTHA
jgi:hypothetical protein